MTTLSRVEAPSTVSSTIPYTITRLGVIMTPNLDDEREVEGVLNPATAWDREGNLNLYPRLVGRGNYSRVGRAIVTTEHGVPTGVARQGIVMQPDRAWEHGDNHGGIEDPRVTWIPSLDLHVMTYVAFGPTGPRPAIAVSGDALEWRRLGPIQFAYDDDLGTDLNLFPNKDVVFFPAVVPGPDGRASYALLHRPMWDLSFVRPNDSPPLPVGITDERPSIWISYIDAADVLADLNALVRPSGHRLVTGPVEAWEHLKIGAGPAPIRIPEGWLLIHHGVSGEMVGGAFLPQQKVRYAAGGMILDADDPSRVIARSPRPLLSPETADEVDGIVANVVFPTAIEEIEGQLYVFYGMADSKIGVARLDRTN